MRINQKIFTYFIAIIWLVNGLFAKILNIIPRHQLIVQTIFQDFIDVEIAFYLTKFIGVSEIILAFWILSGYQSRLVAILQIILVLTMNIIEFASVLITILNSLLVSFYIYDSSDLYKLNWLKKIGLETTSKQKIINIHAGFDETSHLLVQKFLTSELSVFDFYDAEKHTEISIKRARKVYPPYPNTKTIQTNNLLITDKSIDTIFLFLAAHEIRNAEERTIFLKN